MVLRRLLVIALLALVSVAGVLATTALANTTTTSAPATLSPTPTSPPPAPTLTTATASAPPATSAPAARGADGVPCLQQSSCAGGVLLAGATSLLFLPAAGLALPAPAPAAPVAAVPTRLRSALLASKLFRPPQAS